MTPQCKTLLKYLEYNGSITSLDAVTRLGIYACSQRIGDLRNKHGFADRIKAVPERTDSGKHIVRYHLMRGEQ